VWINAQVRGSAESLRQVQFATLDLMRRAQGHALGAIGFDPIESPHRRLASGDNWRLRDYGGPGPETSLLVVAAPIKRSYIWDLRPDVSAIRYCLSHGVRVYLVEWIPPTPSGGHVGLDEYVSVISECVATIATEPTATNVGARKSRYGKGCVSCGPSCRASLQREPGQTRSPLAPAPSFEEIAKTPGMTAAALAFWLTAASHPAVPNLILPSQQLRDVSAYILSLRD